MENDLISRKDLFETERLLMTDVVKDNQTARYILEQVLYDIENVKATYGFNKVIERLQEELSLADREKERCERENPLQFDEAKGYARGIAATLEIVKSGFLMNDKEKLV